MPKLTESQREEIIQMYTSGEFKAKEIAEMFTVNQQTVYNTLLKAGIKPAGRWPKTAEKATKEAVSPLKVAPTEANNTIAVEPATVTVAVSIPEPEPIVVEDIKSCKKCGKEFNSEFLFCPWCGEKSKTEGEIIYDNFMAARAKSLKFVPLGQKTEVEKAFIDAANYMKWLMKKTGQC